MGVSQVINSCVTGEYECICIPLRVSVGTAVLFLGDRAALNGDDVPMNILIGQSINTGVPYVPFGRSTFYESKIEFPGIIDGNVTFKHTILISTLSMAMSAKYITGLNAIWAHHNLADSDENHMHFEIGDYVDVDYSFSQGERKVPDSILKDFEAPWIGSNTSSPTRFILAQKREPRCVQISKLTLFLSKILNDTNIRPLVYENIPAWSFDYDFRMTSTIP